MPTLNAATRAQLFRLARLLVVTLATAPAVVSLFHAWELRYPVLGVVIGLCEVIWRTIAPTVPAPSPVTRARHAASTITEQQLTQPAASAPTSEQMYTPVTQPAAGKTLVPEHGQELTKFTKPGTVVATPSIVEGDVPPGSAAGSATTP